MTSLQPAFQKLLVSPAQLALCTQAASMTQLLGLLKQWWHREHVSDEELLAELNACNQQVLDLDARILARHWLPYHYHGKTRTLSWCLTQGRPTTPFFDQFIDHCRQQLVVNQFVRPKTRLAHVLDKTPVRPKSPSGFIFHVSRCGSTLVSGCLAELERTRVLSESPLLTELLLDSGLTADEQRQLLPTLMDFQGRCSPSSNGIIVKWNTWDMFHWPLIRSLYPRVPVLLLVREPVEILASHQYLAGRHMAGDPSLARLNPVFTGMLPDEGLLDFRIRVLHSLLDTMREISEEPGVMVVDYAQIDAETICAISRHFGITPSGDEYARIQQRMKFHSKEPQQHFQPDSLQKRRRFTADERDKIDRHLNPPYHRLLTFTRMQSGEAARC